MISRRASLATPQTSITRATVIAVIRTQPGTSPRSLRAGRATEHAPVGRRHGGISLRSAGELGQRDEARVEGEQDHDRQFEEHDRDEVLRILLR